MAALVFVVGCGGRTLASGDAGASGSSSSSGGNRGGSSSGGSSSSGSSPSGGGSGTSSGGIATSCQQQKGQSCDTCCKTAYASGSDDLVAFIQDCVCANGTGPCAIACDTEYCVSGTSTSQSDPCALCVDDYSDEGGSCWNQIEAQCTADLACSAFRTCTQGCQP